MKRFIAGTFLMVGSLNASQVFNYDFESGAVPGDFSGAGFIQDTGSAPAGLGLGQYLLRNASGVGSEAILTKNGLLPHTSVTLDFTFVAIDSWDGGGPIAWSCCEPDELVITVDGTEKYREAYRNVFILDGLTTDGTATFLAGDGSNWMVSSWNESAWRVSLTFAHTGSSLAIGFSPGGAGWQAGDDESLGIDNVTVTTNGSLVPEPATGLLVAAAGALALVARKRLA
ncbi:MAG: PEP-CTERM sorting domain-containing protein [Acidobacteria bacterium]|nr:PEP-CTERM sorting domain-containing protein [Acidobacteriota bacterium]